MLVLFAPSSTNIDSLQVLCLIELKQDRLYARGHSKSIASSSRMVIDSDDELIPSMCPKALPLHHKLHVQPDLCQKRMRPV